MKRFFILIVLTLLYSASALAQGGAKYTVEGTVSLKETGEIIPFAQVVLKETSQWSFTNDKGEFKITGVFPGKYTLFVSAIGYVDYNLVINITGDIKNFKVQMLEDNLALEEIVVTAEAGETMNSSSKLNKSAIEHLQATSLSDLMQLVPGNTISNPQMSSKQRITIRTAGVSSSSDLNNARGVAYMVNGNRVQNDASLSMGNDVNAMDFRSYSPENIESVEVLKGVVSAEYGDLTSGAVLVKTKAGRTPLEVKFKADPYLKGASINKGFGLGKDKGYMNLDLDYANYNTKLVSTTNILDRVNFGVTYSNTFNQDNTPFRLNVRLTGSYLGNNVTSDPDSGKNDYTKSGKKDFSLAAYGMWQLNKSWITTLNYNLSANFGVEYNRDYTELSQSLLPDIHVTEEGIHVGTITSGSAKQLKKVEDMPLYLNAKLTAHLNKKYKGTLFNTLYGVEWNTKGNEGNGEWYEGDVPQYFRHQPYRHTPYAHDFNAFLEQKVVIPIGKTSFEMSAGVRFTKMFYKHYDLKPIVDPRFNAKYEIFKGNKKNLVRNFAIRGGWGLLDKLPSMNMLYGGDTYLDYDLFRYNETNFSIIQTSIDPEIKDYDFKPVRTRNIELGFDMNIGGVKLGVTYFNEYLKNGIESARHYLAMDVNRYGAVNYSGADPRFVDGVLYIKDADGFYVEHTDFTRTTEFKSSTSIVNNRTTKKWGIEYDINFGKIQAINTSIIANGSYVKSDGSYSGTSEYYNIGQRDPLDAKQAFPYIAIFNGNSSVRNGVLQQKFNTNVNFVTNIPKLRMVLTLTMQCIWMDKQRSNLDNAYTTVENGVYIKDPVAYMDATGTVRPFTDYYTTTDSALKMRLGMMRISDSFAYNYLTASFNPYFMANIRVSKEIGKFAAISFYANNFTNSKPLMKSSARPHFSGYVKNTDLYFGAEIKVTL